MQMREMILSVSMTAIAAGLFRMLIPDNCFKKQIAFLAACFFALSAVNVFGGAGLDVSVLSEALRQEGVYMDFTEEAYRITQTEIAENLSANLKKTLAQEEIYPENIFVIIDISGSFSISIIEIRLVFSSEHADSISAAEKRVTEEVGDGIKVVSEIKA